MRVEGDVGSKGASPSLESLAIGRQCKVSSEREYTVSIVKSQFVFEAPCLTDPPFPLFFFLSFSSLSLSFPLPLAHVAFSTASYPQRVEPLDDSYPAVSILSTLLCSV